MNDKETSTKKASPWIKRHWGWLASFLLPFFVVGGCETVQSYHSGQMDIDRTRLSFTVSSPQPGDFEEIMFGALSMGGLLGTTAGIVGLAGYTIFAGCRMLLKNSFNRSS